MDFSKLAVGTLIGGIIYFFAGWLIYGIALKEAWVYPEGTETLRYAEDEFKISFMAVSCLVWGLMLTFVFQRWAGISTIKGGAIGGAILAAMISLSVGLAIAAEWKFGSINNIAMDVVGNAVCSALAGAGIGWWLGRK